MTRHPVVSVVRSLGLLAVLSLGVPLTAAAQQTCTDADRKAFTDAVNAGATEAELEQRFARCRELGTTGWTAVTTNFNIWYEKMNSCGLHPQQRRPACDVEIRQNFGYGGFGGPPAGSFEYVRFCFDCNNDNIFEYSVVGSVHVTDNPFPAAQGPVWYHSANAVATNTPTTCAWGSGRAIRMRAILSWNWVPPTCTSNPFWGNRIDFPARLDP